MNYLEFRLGLGVEGDVVDFVIIRDIKFFFFKEVNGKQYELFFFFFDIMQYYKEGNGKQKLRQISKVSSELVRRFMELFKVIEGQFKFWVQIELKVKVVDFIFIIEQKREERKVNSNNNNKKQLNYIKEEKLNLIFMEFIFFSEYQNNKLVLVEFFQLKGKNKKNKKKKGDRVNNLIDDVFFFKDIDLDSVDMDEIEREVEYFKRFCLDFVRQI